MWLSFIIPNNFVFSPFVEHAFVVVGLFSIIQFLGTSQDSNAHPVTCCCNNHYYHHILQLNNADLALLLLLCFSQQYDQCSKYNNSEPARMNLTSISNLLFQWESSGHTSRLQRQIRIEWILPYIYNSNDVAGR